MDTRTIITSRGCVGTCKFCTTPYYFGKWNGRNVIDVVNEIEMLISKYNTKKIIFLDDNVTVSKLVISDLHMIVPCVFDVLVGNKVFSVFNVDTLLHLIYCNEDVLVNMLVKSVTLLVSKLLISNDVNL